MRCSRHQLCEEHRGCYDEVRGGSRGRVARAGPAPGRKLAMLAIAIGISAGSRRERLE